MLRVRLVSPTCTRRDSERHCERARDDAFHARSPSSSSADRDAFGRRLARVAGSPLRPRRGSDLRGRGDPFLSRIESPAGPGMTTASRASEAQPLLRRERPSAAARATRASLVAVAIAAVLAAVAVAGVSSRFNNVLASSSLGSLDAALGDAGAPARSLHVGARGHSRFHAARLGEEDAEPIIPRASAPEPADDPDSDDDARATLRRRPDRDAVRVVDGRHQARPGAF